MWLSVVEFLNAIHFLHPGWLWAWLLSLLAISLLLKGNRLGALARVPELFGAQSYRHTRLETLRQLYSRKAQQRTARGAFRRWVSYALLLLCIHVALAQPYRLGQQLPTPPEYRDTIYVVDTSISMVLRDYLVAGKRVDRMTMLKSVLTHFIEQLKGNRIGLIAFSEQAYTLVPLTADSALLKIMVRRLQPAVLTGRTSNLGKAMLYTLRQLQESDASNLSQKPVLVLVTDVNRTYRDVDPPAVAAYLYEQGYRLYTIGIGASSYEAQESRPSGLIYQPANFGLLKSIAERGGGQFYWADNVGSLQSAIQAIQSAERRQVEVEPRYITIPLYQWPLLAGLLWIVMLQLWAGRGKRL